MELPLNTIINRDCLAFMKTLPDKCIDLVLTDPPYGIGIDGSDKSVNKKGQQVRKQYTWGGGIVKSQVKNILTRY